MNLRATLEQRITAAMIAAGAPDAPGLVAPAARPQFGDYQANGCMAAAKKLKINPRQFAEKVIEKLDLSDLTEKVEVAGAGFINIFLKDAWVGGELNTIAGDERLGVAKPQAAKTVVVDYSGPNLAKEMHVGHLRSTIIGDALARILDFLGHHVIRQNHVGDWGTQFGMLIAYLPEYRDEIDQYHQSRGETAYYWTIDDMEKFYREAKQRFDQDEAFANRARECVVKLQSGDSKIQTQWKVIVGISLGHAREVYERLGVLLKGNDVWGESEYNDDLPNVVKDLEKAGLLSQSEGAKGVYLDEFTNKDNERAFVIVQKSDGGYLYATTDLAAIRYRVGERHADRILYVTDSRQALHFQQVFTIARKAGFAGEDVSLEHIAFGMMLGTDGRPFKTRTGGTVKLMDLIDEAEKRAADLVRQKNPDLDEQSIEKIAHTVGIGALKYADLSQNRTSDCVFSWNKMLSLEGNTAPYMQYAYARIRSIFRKAQGSTNYTNDTNSEEKRKSEASAEVTDTTSRERKRAGISLTEPAERTLGVKLLQFPETIEAVAETCTPNTLCAYLYELAGAFMGFYESCPVLKAPEPVRDSRLALCDLTAKVVKQSLELLGIETLERM